MKILLTLALLMVSAFANAAVNDRNYSFSDTDGAERVRVFNDGRNTVIESMPGLVIRGATADGDRLIITGLPSEIRGSLNGHPLIISRFSAPPARKVEQSASTGSSVSAKLAALEASLSQAESKLQRPMNTVGVPAAVATSADWRIGADDPNMRKLFERWAKLASWGFVWDVDVDIPLTPQTRPVDGDFKKAVRYVLSSTELGEQSLKPCFYSNNVIRVVRKTAKCDPSE